MTSLLLYALFPRVKRKELTSFTIYKNHPALWQTLKEWDKRTWRKFRADYSAEELEVRFDFEEECLKAGKPIKGKAFFSELKRRLEVEA